MKCVVPLFVFAVGLLVALAFWSARAPAVDGPGGFDLLAFFEGEASSAGTVTTALVFETPFTAAFAGQSTAGVLRLEERFAFPDKAPLQVWRLTVNAGGTLAGTVETEGPDGVLQPAVPVRGRSDAAGVTLAYEGFAPGGARRLGFRHLMRMRSDGTVANHVVVSLFGLPLAVSDVTFVRDGAALPSSAGGG